LRERDGRGHSKEKMKKAYGKNKDMPAFRDKTQISNCKGIFLLYLDFGAWDLSFEI
jgi:hypothetical protein